MAIKRITDLPIINIRKQDLSAVDESWMEMSFCQSEGSYVSRGFKYGNLKEDIFYHILSGGDDHKTEFYCSVDFMEPVRMFNDLAISGDFLLNEDMPDYELHQYRVLMRSGQMKVFSDSDISLSSNEMIRMRSFGDTRIEASDEFALSTRKIIVNSNDTSLNDTSDTQLINVSRNMEDELLLHVYVKSQFDKDVHFKKNVYIDDNLKVGKNLTCYDMYGHDISCNDIGCRDVYGKMFYGVALCAMWADIAEKYESDANYEPGTLVKFGGEKEITVADTEANAVVTDSPGFILNSNGHGLGIALTGRTPVKVKGKVERFQKIYLSREMNGIGSTENNGKPIGISLGKKDSDGVGLVECVVKMEF